MPNEYLNWLEPLIVSAILMVVVFAAWTIFGPKLDLWYRRRKFRRAFKADYTDNPLVKPLLYEKSVYPVLNKLADNLQEALNAKNEVMTRLEIKDYPSSQEGDQALIKASNALALAAKKFWTTWRIAEGFGFVLAFTHKTYLTNPEIADSSK